MVDDAASGKNVRQNTARDGAKANEADAWPTCFVAMPVTTPTQYAEVLKDPAHFQHVLYVLFMPALDRAGYRMIPPTASGAQQIHAGIIRNLEQADLVLCDLSGLNPNVFFELGIRTSLDRPLALVKDRMTERIPFDLSGINTYTYDETIASWSVARDIETLAAHISAVEIGRDAGNEMWRFLGLTKRATSAEIEGDPTQAKLDLILKEMTRPQSISSAGGSSVPLITQRFAFTREAEDYLKASGLTLSVDWDRSDPQSRRVFIDLGVTAPPEIRNDILELAARHSFEAYIKIY